MCLCIPPEIDPPRRLAWLSSDNLPAWRFAHQAHLGQVRSADGSPYITHPETVAALVHAWGGSTWAVKIALLHDTLEDGPAVTEDMLRQHFDGMTLNALGALTKQRALQKAQRGAEALARLRTALETGLVPLETGLVKLADRAHNMVTAAHLLPATKRALASDAHFYFAPLARAYGMDGLAAWYETWTIDHDLANSTAVDFLSQLGREGHAAASQ